MNTITNNEVSALANEIDVEIDTLHHLNNDEEEITQVIRSPKAIAKQQAEKMKANWPYCLGDLARANRSTK